ncbi:hypothetical protein P3T22_003704 [Paraburkholderia sp. GAS348]
MQSELNNPESFAGWGFLSDVKPDVAIVDRGCKGVAIDTVKIYHPDIAMRHHAHTARDHQAAQCNRASDRPHEGRWKT